MSFVHGRGTRPDGDADVEVTMPTRPADKLCECHGEPARWIQSYGSRPPYWRCRVDERRHHATRELRKARTTDGHTRRQVFDLGGGRCYLCGIALTWDAWDEDHVIPIAVGGPDTLENCRPACRDCHRAKGSSIYVFGEGSEFHHKS